MAFGLTHTDQLKRKLELVTAERDGFKALAESYSRDLWNAQQELAKAPIPQPTDLKQVTHFLRAFVPTLPYAPGYSSLTTATDAKSFAMALNLLLQHARLVGRQEGQAK